MTTAGLAVALRVGQSIAIEAGQTFLACASVRVVNAFEALAGSGIAVADGVWVDVAVAVALRTAGTFAVAALRVTRISVDADVALMSYSRRQALVWLVIVNGLRAE